MSNALRGSESAPVQWGKGQTGHVQLSTTVPPELKGRLVDLCLTDGLTQRVAVEAALTRYLDAEGF